LTSLAGALIIGPILLKFDQTHHTAPLQTASFPMPRVLVLYATTEGQTARIAERVAATLRSRGHVAESHSADAVPAGLDWSAFDGIVIGAAIHYGHHPAYLRTVVRRHRGALAARPCAFFSVSLSGGGPGAKPEAAKRYLEKFLRQTGWHPEQTASFAGALQFSKYGAFKRMLMLLFVGLAGGDTDTTRDYEYTDWDSVERFARGYAERLNRA
jgi:menaquinone-dependent protoporphyrinogen oxidase